MATNIFRVVPETNLNMVDTIEPSDLTNDSYMDSIMNTIMTEAPIKRRRSSCSSSSSLSSCSSSSSSEDEGEAEDFSSITNRDASDSSDSEAEQEVISPYVHRRQMEELILDKITNHLDAEKLPGILTIISKAHEEEVEEVEIDLAKLDRDQLGRILSYVNACLMEKEGGPKVKLSDYTIQQKPVIQQKEKTGPIKQQTRRRRNRRKSIVEEGHVVNGSLPSRLSSTHGPISMSALTDFETSPKKNQRKKRVKKIKNDDDISVHMSTDLNIFKDSIASTKPKRKSAIHKRRLLEEMLQPSNEDSEDDDDEDNGSGIIVFGDEQMDLAVTHNETIVHQESLIESIIIEEEVEEVEEEEEEEEDDELIDIMM